MQALGLFVRTRDSVWTAETSSLASMGVRTRTGALPVPSLAQVHLHSPNLLVITGGPYSTITLTLTIAPLQVKNFSQITFSSAPRPRVSLPLTISDIAAALTPAAAAARPNGSPFNQSMT